MLVACVMVEWIDRNALVAVEEASAVEAVVLEVEAEAETMCHGMVHYWNCY